MKKHANCAFALVAAAGTFLWLGSTAMAQSSDMGSQQGSYGSSQQTQGAQKKEPDAKFIRDAAEGTMQEIRLGQLAEQRGSSDAVKNYGRQMVQDHTKLDQQVKQLASQKGVSVPSTLEKKDQKTYDRLSKLSGSEFDREYMKYVTKEHREALADYQREAQHGQDPQVKQFASNTVPSLQHHLTLAEQTASQVGVATGQHGTSGNASQQRQQQQQPQQQQQQ